MHRNMHWSKRDPNSFVWNGPTSECRSRNPHRRPAVDLRTPAQKVLFGMASPPARKAAVPLTRLGSKQDLFGTSTEPLSRCKSSVWNGLSRAIQGRQLVQATAGAPRLTRWSCRYSPLELKAATNACIGVCIRIVSSHTRINGTHILITCVYMNTKW